MRDGHAWSGSEVTAHKNVSNKLNCQVSVAEPVGKENQLFAYKDDRITLFIYRAVDVFKYA